MNCPHCGRTGLATDSEACPDCGSPLRTAARVTEIDVDQTIDALAGGEAVGVKIGTVPGTVNIHLPAGPTPFPTIHTLRAPVPDFTGRQDQTAALLAHLDRDGASAYIIGIRGMGGIGKTELAIFVANQLTTRYPDARLMFELQPGGLPLTPEALLAAVVRAFHPAAQLPGALPELQALYRQSLSGRHGLLLLDNAADAAQVRPLLPPTAGWAVLVTSRARFPLPGARLIDLDVMPTADAVALLHRLLGDGGRQDLITDGQAVTDDVDGTATSFGRLARLCGYLPLALRLAAGYLTAYLNWSLATYLEALQTRPLQQLDVPGDEGITQTLGLSVDRLVADNRDLAHAWYELAVFPAPFDLPAAVAVWGSPSQSAAQTDLGELIRRSLLDYDLATDTYALHDLLRAYALASMRRDTVDQDEARLRHAHHYLATAAAIQGRFSEDQVLYALNAFDRIWPHLAAAWEWMRDRTDDTSLHWLDGFASSMSQLLHLRLPPQRRMRFLESALAAARHFGDRQAAAGHLIRIGIAYADLGETRRAVSFYDEALQIAREVGDRRGEGNALANKGIAYAALGEIQRAIPLYNEALQIAREMEDRRDQGIAVSSLGIAYNALGEPGRAIEFHEQHLPIAREIGDRQGEGNALTNLGLAYADLGELPRAAGLYQQALEIYREIGDRRGEGNALSNLGTAHAALRETQKAVTFHEQALAIYREIGDRRGEGNALTNLGLGCSAVGDTAGAVKFYEQALAIYREIGDRRGEGNALGNLGNVYAALGETHRAIAFYEQHLQIAREIGDRRGEANSSWNLALAHVSLGNHAGAARLMQVTVDYERAIGHGDAEAHARRLEEIRRQLPTPDHASDPRTAG